MYTEGKNLYAHGYRWLVSAVGPRCNAKEDVSLVQYAYREALEESAKVGATSILFPRLSALAFGCPAEKIDLFAVNTVVDYLAKNSESSVNRVVFIFYPGTAADMVAIKNYKKLLDDRVKK